MLQAMGKFRSQRTRENLEKLRLLVEEIKIQGGEMTKPDPDQPDAYVGRDEYGMPLDGRGRHLSRREKIAERDMLFQHYSSRQPVEGDLVPGGRLARTAEGILYVEPEGFRDLFPEERLSKTRVKGAKP